MMTYSAQVSRGSNDVLAWFDSCMGGSDDVIVVLSYDVMNLIRSF